MKTRCFAIVQTRSCSCPKRLEKEKIPAHAHVFPTVVNFSPRHRTAKTQNGHEKRHDIAIKSLALLNACFRRQSGFVINISQIDSGR